MDNRSESIEIKRKRLLFRSKHRGTKEMDILIGGYYEENMESFSPEELTEFEAVLEYPDDNLYSWALERAPVPSKFFSPVLQGFIDSVKCRGGGSFH
jgi:antitoxin CptB